MKQDEDATGAWNPDNNEQADDVATLYSWANLHGAKYRDFSASRQEMRQQMRQRTLADRARVAREEAQKGPPLLSESPRREDLLPAGGRQAAASAPVRHEIERRFENPPEPERMPERIPDRMPERMPEMMSAPVDTGSTTRHGLTGAPYFRDDGAEQRPVVETTPDLESAEMRPAWLTEIGFPGGSMAPAMIPASDLPPLPRERLPERNPPEQKPVPERDFRSEQSPQPELSPQNGFSVPVPVSPVQSHGPAAQSSGLPVQTSGLPIQVQASPVTSPSLPVQVPGSDSPQQSRDRVASRWYALRGVLGRNQEEVQPSRTEGQVPVLAVFSLAGGVGKTSLVAAMGRGLAARGERVLLTDTCSFGVLPFYFGGREIKAGVIRTFSGGTSDPPIRVLTLDAERYEADPDLLRREMARGAQDVSRVLIDVATGSSAMLHQAVRMAPILLVPVVPDMASVVTLQALEGFFRSQEGLTGKPLQAWFVLNQFDASSALHLDVREVLRQQLGERLLPFAVHRSPAMSEALAEGMTVIDYAPNSPAAEDIVSLVTWIRSTSVAASAVHRSVRWSER
jgi:cellulose synthase operon protein YhjQ